LIARAVVVDAGIIDEGAGVYGFGEFTNTTKPLGCVIITESCPTQGQRMLSGTSRGFLFLPCQITRGSGVSSSSSSPRFRRGPAKVAVINDPAVSSSRRLWEMAMLGEETILGDENNEEILGS
jgi:hypothetical protein